MKKIAVLSLIFLILIFLNDSLPKFIQVPLWFNALMHFLGGMAAAYFFGSFWKVFSRSSFDIAEPWFRMLIIVSGAALLGIFWEFFEYTFFGPEILGRFTDVWLYIDTIRDLKMNILGSVVAAFFYAMFSRR